MLQQTGLQQLILHRHKIPSFERYPFNLPIFHHLETLPLHPGVTFLTGENGMGKSTLIEAMAIANRFNAEGGSIHLNFATRASHSELHEYISFAKGPQKFTNGYFLRSESFFNMATQLEERDSTFKDYGGVSLHEQSHGESFWALFMHRFSGNGLYILDEPEAALSPTRQMALLARMHELIAQKSQFIIATHSPILMAYPSSTIYELSESGIQPVAYKETANYNIFRRFLNNPEDMLRILLEPDAP